MHDDIATYLKKKNLNEYFQESRIYKAYNFLTFLKDLNLKLEYVKSGSTGHCFKGYNNTNSCAIKIVAYTYKHNDKYGDIFNTKRPENVEFYILDNLNNINNFQHITNLLGGFYTNIDIFEKINVKNKKLHQFKKNIQENLYEPICSVMISEYCQLGDLQNYLEKNRNTINDSFFKVIFFQLMFSLVVIHDKCDSFKHNDLKCNNILLQTTNPNITHFQYKVGSITFKIPNIGICVKLWDFDFATGPCVNLKVRQNWAKELNINEEKNLYYDIHFFFNSLIHVFPILINREKNEFSQELYDFIDFVIPPMYRYQNNSKKKKKNNYRLKYNHEHISPLYLLQIHHYFDDLKT